jgi:hypothetical protein
LKELYLGKRSDFEKKVGKEIIEKLEDAGLIGELYDEYNYLTDVKGIPTVVARHYSLNKVMPRLDPEWKPLTSADVNSTDARIMLHAKKKYGEYMKDIRTPAAEGVSGGGSKGSSEPSRPSPYNKKKVIGRKETVNIPESVMEKAADVVEVIEWVAKNIERPFCYEVIETAPCAEAVGLLRYYSATEHNKGEFFEKQYSKLIPSRAQLSHRGSVDLDGKQVLEAIQHIKNGNLDFEMENIDGKVDSRFN